VTLSPPVPVSDSDSVSHPTEDKVLSRWASLPWAFALYPGLSSLGERFCVLGKETQQQQQR
jgi:hypothetical protein